MTHVQTGMAFEVRADLAQAQAAREQLADNPFMQRHLLPFRASPRFGLGDEFQMQFMRRIKHSQICVIVLARGAFQP